MAATSTAAELYRSKPYRVRLKQGEPNHLSSTIWDGAAGGVEGVTKFGKTTSIDLLHLDERWPVVFRSDVVRTWR